MAVVSEQRVWRTSADDFVANVSHELKDTVGALSLLAEAIQYASGRQRWRLDRFDRPHAARCSRMDKLVQRTYGTVTVQGDDTDAGGHGGRRARTSSPRRSSGPTGRRAGESRGHGADQPLQVRGKRPSGHPRWPTCFDNAIATSGGCDGCRERRRSHDDEARPPATSPSRTGAWDAEADGIVSSERFPGSPRRARGATGGKARVGDRAELVQKTLGTMACGA